MARGRLFFITAKMLRELRRLRRKVDTMSGVGVVNTPDAITILPIGGQGGGIDGTTRQPRPFAAQITSNTPADDHITVKRVKADDSLEPSEKQVAKPYNQRGERYPLQAGDRVIVYPVARTGTNGSGSTDLKFVVEFALPAQPADGNTYTIECGTDGSLSWELSGDCEEA